MIPLKELYPSWKQFKQINKYLQLINECIKNHDLIYAKLKVNNIVSFENHELYESNKNYINLSVLEYPVAMVVSIRKISNIIRTKISHKQYLDKADIVLYYDELYPQIIFGNNFYLSGIKWNDSDLFLFFYNLYDNNHGKLVLQHQISILNLDFNI